MKNIIGVLMLLSIDRVLQLLSEGKPVEKIAELASCDKEDILKIIQEARALISSFDKAAGKKKIILKRKSLQESGDNISSLLTGAELSAMPMDARLTFYVAADTESEAQYSGIGIVIYDEDGRQVGKVSMYIGKAGKYSGVYSGIARALRIAGLFQAKDIRIRISSDAVRAHFYNEINIDDDKLLKQRDELLAMIKDLSGCRIESVSDALNDKAAHLASKGLERIRK
ncbi:MAG: reverse transcriptase-like protein [Leptospirales bacterium]|nr:reverse transcriptase-like protein [Leptospirales bacterium]